MRFAGASIAWCRSKKWGCSKQVWFGDKCWKTGLVLEGCVGVIGSKRRVLAERAPIPCNLFHPAQHLHRSFFLKFSFNDFSEQSIVFSWSMQVLFNMRQEMLFNIGTYLTHSIPCGVAKFLKYCRYKELTAWGNHLFSRISLFDVFFSSSI